MFIDHRETLKMILAGLKENLAFLKSLPAVPIFSCNQTIAEIKKIKELLEKLDKEWLDEIDKKGKK
jgi:hypothetical protein